jgi:hypothetical protein
LKWTEYLSLIWDTLVAMLNLFGAKKVVFLFPNQIKLVPMVVECCEDSNDIKIKSERFMGHEVWIGGGVFLSFEQEIWREWNKEGKVYTNCSLSFPTMMVNNYFSIWLKILVVDKK